ncbi:MAG: sel1 repeat family protein [Gammaproteobacteria bacterium]|nr:sel1 repeat family protein [Gammaproteobacteria bacterium]MCW8988639.1 sel1 repeat family protein [Gammaproteobacteria bacterium]MCW9030076.1 sel1 repeat family protein [Gammaproteobacteria bacterium]
MLNRFILTLIITQLSFLTYTVKAGELEDGFASFKAGNYEQALRLWLPIAEKDNADAQYNLGILYMKGLGVEKNEKTAFIWYKRSAANGNTDAMYNLGTMYNQGRVVIRSTKDAVKWWQKSAELGNAAGQFNLGVVYAYGRRVKQNTDEALKWWKKSAQQGNKDARAALYQTYTEGLFDLPVNPQEAKRWK